MFLPLHTFWCIKNRILQVKNGKNYHHCYATFDSLTSPGVCVMTDILGWWQHSAISIWNLKKKECASENLFNNLCGIWENIDITVAEFHKNLILTLTVLLHISSKQHRNVFIYFLICLLGKNEVWHILHSICLKDV